MNDEIVKKKPETKSNSSPLLENELPSTYEDNSEKKEDLDTSEYLAHVGSCGLYQLRTQILFFLFIVPFVSQIFITYFVVHDPAWRCKQNATECTYTYEVIPQSNAFRDKCLIPRDQWEFTKLKSYSIVTQFDLVCDRAYYIIICNSMVFIGWALGAIILSYLSDQYGRKMTIYPALLIIIFSAILTVIANNLAVFIITRFVIGIALGGVPIIFVLAAEITGKKYRALSCTAIWIYFSISLVILTGVSYILQDWKKIELAVSVPFLCLIFTWSCLPESVRWLRMQGRINDAEKLLHKIATVNGKEAPTVSLHYEDSIQAKASFIELFRPHRMLLQTLIQSYVWLLMGLTYFAASYSSHDLSGSFYRDFISTSVIEVPANIAVIVCANRHGRKSTVISHCIFGAIASAVVAFTPFKPNASIELKPLVFLL